MESYIVQNKDFETRINSRSGGMFTAVSDLILSQNGTVYGAKLNTDMTVSHSRAATKEERDSFRGSKYVRSEFASCIPMIEEDLKAGKWVLFSGTGCQVAAVKKKCELDNIDCEKLLCMDIVCHGAPQAKIWNKYVEYLEKKYSGKITDFNFRNKKRFGWKSHVETFTINGKTHVSREFTDLFYQHLLFAKTCFNCQNKSLNRQGDISLADAWGPLAEGYKDNKGTSLVLVSTDKGKKFFENCSDKLNYYECNMKEFMQPPLMRNYEMPANYQQFWQDVENLEWKALYKKYTNTSPKIRLMRKVKYLLK